MLFSLRETKAPARAPPPPPRKVAGLCVKSRAKYKMSAWVTIPKLTFAINGFTTEPFCSMSILWKVIILKDHTVEWIMFSLKNNVLSWLGMGEQGLDLEFIIALYDSN